MVKTLNTDFPAERSEDNVNVIYVETLTKVYKDLYHATTNGEKSVLKAIEEGDDYIVAKMELTVEDDTSKQLVRIQEGSDHKILLNDSLYSIIEENEKAAAEKVIAEKKAATAAKTEAVTNLIVNAIDEQAKAVQIKAKLDFDKVIKESKKKVKASQKKPIAIKTKVVKKEEVVVEKAKQELEQVEEQLVETSKYVQKQVMEELEFNPEKGNSTFQADMKKLKTEITQGVEAMFQEESRRTAIKIESMSGGGGGGGDLKQTNINTADIAELSASSTFSPLISSNHTAIAKLILSGTSGYDVTGAFEGKDPDAGNVWTSTGGIAYTSAEVNRVKTFSLDPTIQPNTDNPYWSVPTPEDAVGVGLFGGAYLPNQPLAKSPIFAFSAVDNDTFEDGSNVVTNGRISLSGASYGDQLRVRFDLIVIPQVTNTTVTPMLWYKNATPAGVVTYSFELPTQPVFYGQGTVGKEHLSRVEISAWIANEEDVHALVYPAVKADNPCIFKPNSMMATILR
jgi:hypothetical protein